MEKEGGWIKNVNHGGDRDRQVIDSAFDDSGRVYGAIFYCINGFADFERSSKEL